MTTNEELLESIAEHYTAAFRSGNPPPLSYYIKKCPSLADEISEVVASLKRMEQFCDVENRQREQANQKKVHSVELLSTLGEFEIVRELGRGGMGVVYEAIDQKLSRRVALKVVVATDAASEKRITRFEREAQLASRLHHTNIVPVFAVGKQSGVCYYAMQYIEGVNLGDVIAGLEQLTGAAPAGEDRDVPGQARAMLSGNLMSDDSNSDLARRCLSDEASAIDTRVDSQTGIVGDDEPHARQRVAPAHQDSPVEAVRFGEFSQQYWSSVATVGRQVCDALRYAHSNGVLHRDVKPANLLLDRTGTIWMTDFGLAKLSDSDDLTKTGDVLGTLRYMAPEQLGGKSDVRTDIYALGLTLYELLTLRPACDGQTYQELLQQKNHQSFPRPRSINRKIPRDLETIVLKALEIEPRNRYSSAGALARDLTRFLEDRPIHARRATTLENSWRWCRRNRTVAALMGVASTLMVVLSVVLAVAYMRESAQRQDTEETLMVALAGLDEVYRSFVDSDQVPQGLEFLGDRDRAAPVSLKLTPEAGQFLERMLVFYDRLAERGAGGDERLTVESAKATRRVGDIYQALGQYAQALDSYATAQTRYAQLEGADYQLEQSLIDLERGRIFDEQGLHEESLQAFDKALSRLKSNLDPENPAVLFTAARTHLLMGKYRAVRTMIDWSVFAHLSPRSPTRNQQDRRRPPARADNGPPPKSGTRPNKPRKPLGTVQRRHLAKALEILDGLLDENPSEASYRFLRALCLREQASRNVFREGDGSERAQAAQILRDLLDEYPNESKYRFELSQTYRQITPRLIKDKDLDRGIEQLEQALKLSDRLFKDKGQVALYRINLAHICTNLGMLYQRKHDEQAAEEYMRLAIKSHDYVIENSPGLALVSKQLSIMPVQLLGFLLQRQGRWIESAMVLEPLAAKLQEQASDPRLSGEWKGEAKQALRNCLRSLQSTYEALGEESSLEMLADQLRPLRADDEPTPHWPSDPLGGSLGQARKSPRGR